jgi:uncharacterized membrane protein YcaP (DUF421 family)
MEHLFFSGWPGLVRTLVLGVLSYLLLIAILRVSGKRTLSKMNAFDLVVTVALGSTLATILLNKQIALAEGVLALLLLIALQFSITWLAVRSRLVESLVKNEPALLMRSGELLRDGMRRERVTESEIRSALRSQGYPGDQPGLTVILETDGSFSVIADAASHDADHLPNDRTPIQPRSEAGPCRTFR